MMDKNSVKPTLIIMAAGMGSRFGGPKQTTAVSGNNEIILDFSLHAAMAAGFEDVVLVIREENQQDFNDLLEGRAADHLNIKYAYQDINNLPGVDLATHPKADKIKAAMASRSKPWGTAHAVLSAKDLVWGPFAVINADDFYGENAFVHIFDFLEGLSKGADDSSKGQEPHHFAMVAYELSKTLSESGHVSRGVCQVSDDSMLTDITERTKILRQPSGEIAFTEDEKTWTPLSEDTLVSMNFWGFGPEMMEELEKAFPAELDRIIEENPEKGEFYLPFAVDALLKEGKADVKVLRTSDKWYGITYPEDLALIKDAIQSMKDKGLLPEVLWA